MKKVSFAGLVLGALGVVYGDIGTSPLYALNEVFFGSGQLPITASNIGGVASLIFWLLLIVIGLKYAVFVLRADYNGEGGAFALINMLQDYTKKRVTIVGFLLMLSAGLLFGEGIITPAISVLSAIEGLTVITPTMEPWIVPISIGILFCIFFFQRNGSSRMGNIYGPIMLLWFITIATLGILQIYLYPQVILDVINPLSAIRVVTEIPLSNLLLLLGAVFLVLTGSEALYADLGHFGKRAIRFGWFGLVFPALILNYTGQSAYLLRGGVVASDNLFYSLVPDHLLLPVIVLATSATIAASVALIFGVYSLVSQAIALSLLPKIQVIHTNQNRIEQIYIPLINWGLCIGSILLVVYFGSATNLAAAYGFAVSSVMVITSIAMIALSRYHWLWNRRYSIIIFGTLLLIDFSFFVANSTKFSKGGFVPFVLGIVIFTIIMIWRWGRKLLKTTYATYTKDRDMRWFIDVKKRLRESGGIMRDKKRARGLVEQDRAVVFVISRAITKLTDNIPVKLRVYIKRKGIIPKNIILLHIKQSKTPYLKHRYTVYKLGKGVYSLVATFGFMEKPDAALVLREFYKKNIFGRRFRRCTIQVSEDEFIVDSDVQWHIKLKLYLYKKLLELSLPAYRYFGLYAEAGTGLSKTVIPVHISRKGSRVEIPEFSMVEANDNIDPDKLEPTEIEYTKVK